MDSIIFESEWNVGDVFTYAWISDPHIHPHCENKGLKQALDYCLSNNIKVSFNGDLADFITVKDPRYNKADDKSRMAGIINDQIEWVVDFLMPYVDIIEVVSTGNHEDVLIRHYGIDVIRAILRDLNREKTNGTIHYGSYQGFQVYRFKYAKGSRTKTLKVFRHHGAGGSAPVTAGAIDINRLFTNYEADLYWLGHKHKSTYREEPLCYCNDKGNIQIKNRRAMMTAGFQQQLTIDDNNANGGRYSYGDRFYGKSANSWGLLTVRPFNTADGSNMELDIDLTMKS